MTANQMIREMVARIVERFDPERVILFGSQARGDARPTSDVDLLVVLSRIDESHRAKALEIRRELHGFGIGKDIVVRTADEFEVERSVVGTLARMAAAEGKILYARPD